jgi:hypothetical protein
MKSTAEKNYSIEKDRRRKQGAARAYSNYLKALRWPRVWRAALAQIRWPCIQN